jgi:hypothetical protein
MDDRAKVRVPADIAKPVPARGGVLVPPTGSRVPAQVRERWTEGGRRRGLQGQALAAYSRRWASLWMATARARRDAPGGWRAAHTDLVEDYVEARRAAEDHQAAAEGDPYPRGSGSRPFPHPGFAAAAAARREAREVLSSLGLLEEPRPDPELGEGGGAPRDDAPKMADQDGL